MRSAERRFALVAQRFKALGEPARLRILDALRCGDATVGELVQRTGLGQANLSKHLQLLHEMGFVVRWKQGLFVHYRLTDDEVFRLCDLMCGRIWRTSRVRLTRFSRPPTPRAAPRSAGRAAKSKG